MEPFKPRAANGEEFFIQNKWVDFFEHKGWLVERMIGNAFQQGIPDLYLFHPDHGARWCDIKVYGRYNYTSAQRHKWPLWDSYGLGVWIIGARNRKECTKAFMIKEYNEVMFNPPNWRNYWKDSWNESPDVDRLLKEIERNEKNNDG